MEQLIFNIDSEAHRQEALPAPTEASSVSAPDDMPLAARMRPVSLEEYVGQEHILGNGKLLRRIVETDRFSSMIFSGPPGTGKTTLAELIAKQTNSAFIRLSGVVSSVADIRREVSAAIDRKRGTGRKTILFIDEIHRFNKAQQDVLLPDVENGNVRLIGATTQNPNFYVIAALLSRSLVFQLEALCEDDVRTIIERAIRDRRGFPELKVSLSEEAMAFLADVCEGDARRALNALEIAVLSTEPIDGKVFVTIEIAEESIQKRAIVYGDDGHYDTASAFIKSMRGSDPDAAVYWLAKMLHAGEDIRFVARRIVIFASEDIGNADPRALSIAVSAMQAVDMIGMPEARIILAQAVTFCSTAPKSNASYRAVDEALEDVRKSRVVSVPMHLRDSHSSAVRNRKESDNYLYPHDHEGHFVDQDYLGVEKHYYNPVNIGFEAKIIERIKYWNQLRSSRCQTRE